MDLNFDEYQIVNKTKKESLDPEELENILIDSNQMPFCSEKIILKLIYYLSKSQLNIKQTFSLDLSSEINLLHERLCKEELLSDKIKEDFNDMKSYFLKFGDFKSAFESLNKILSNIRDINVQELIRLTESNSEAIKLIKNKNIHLIIGLTGSGKSTTLHFLGGSRMINVTKNGQPHIEAAKVNNKYLEKVKSSASIMSETRNIIPVLIEADKNLGLDESSLIFCDSPGFEDTNGAEIDISNSIAIQRSIEECKGIKPIVVTSKLAGDRFERLAILTEILSGMFYNFEKNLIYFAYIFTKFPVEEKTSVRNTLINIRDDLNKQAKGEDIDKSFKLVIQDMISKSTRKGENNNNYVVLDPITDDPNESISFLVDEKYIQTPSRELKINFSSKSKSKLERQIEKHFKLIEVALSLNENELALFKLNELIRLRDVIKQDDFIEKFEEVFNNLVKSLNKENDSSITRFNRKLERSDPINGDDYEDYIKCLKNSYVIHIIINKVNMTKLNKYQEFVDNLSIQARKLNVRLKSINLEEEPENVKIALDNLNFLVRIWNFNSTDILEKETSLSENEVTSIFKESCALLETNLSSLKKEILSIIETSEFDNISKYLSKIELFGKLFEEHFSSFSKYYDETKQKLIEKFETLLKESEEIVLQEKHVNKNNKIILYDNELYLSKAKRCSILHLHISLDKIESFINRLLELIYKFSENLIDAILLNIPEINIDNRRSSVDLDLIKSSFYQLNLIIENDLFYNKIRKKYNEALDSLVYLTQKLKNGLESQVQGFINNNDNMENCINRFVQKVGFLSKLSWIDDFKKNVCSYALSDIADDISTHIEGLKLKLNNQKVVLARCSNLSTIYEMVRKFVELEPCVTCFPNLEEPIKSAKDWFTHELEREFDKVISSYSNTNDPNELIDFDHCEDAIKFLEECEKISIKESFLGPKYITAKIKLKDSILKRVSFLKVNIETSLDSINEDKFENLRLLSEHLNEVDGLKNFSNILSYHPGFNPKDYMAWIKIQLDEIFVRFENKLNVLITIGNANVLSKKLNILKKLRKLDDYSSEKFSDLFTRYAQNSRNDSKSTFDRSKNLIEENKFQDLNVELCRLNKEDEIDHFFYKFLIDKLKNKLKNLSKKAITQLKMLDELNSENLIDLNSYMQQIENAKQYINEHLDESTNAQLSANDKIIKECIHNLFSRYLKSIEDSVRNFNIDDKASQITQMKPLLINFFDNEELEKLNNLKNNISNLTMDSIEKFRDFKIEDYNLHSPKEVYKKIDSNENAKVAFKKLIKKKYEDRLQEAKNVKELSIDSNEHLKICNRSLSFLPDDIKNDIEHLIQDVIEEIKNLLLQNELEMHKKMDSDDFESIACKYQEYLNNNETENTQKIQMYINEKNNQFSKDLNEFYAKNNLKTFFQIFEKLLNLDKCFSKHFTFIKTNVTENVEKIKSIFTESKLKFYEVFKNKASNVKLKENLFQFFEKIELIVAFDQRNHNKNLFNHNSDNSFKKLLDKLSLKMQTTIVENQRNFQADLNDLIIDNLENSLNWTFLLESFVNKNDNILINSNQEIESYEMLKTQILEKIKALFNDLMQIEFLANDNESKVHKDFDKFFDEINIKIDKVTKIKQRLKFHFSNENIDQYEENFLSFLDSNVNQFSCNCVSLFDKILNSNYSKKDVDGFYSAYYNLSSMSKKLSAKIKQIQIKSDTDIKLEDSLNKKIDSLIANLNSQDLDKVAKVLINIKNYSNVFYIYKEKIDEKINKTLLNYIEKNGGFETIGKLALLLREDVNGNMIVSEHKTFECYNRSIFNKKTLSQDIDYVLANLKGNNLDIEKLKKFYKEFDDCFKELIHRYMRPKIDYNIFISNMHVLIGNLRPSEFKWDDHIKKNLPILIANIFVLWSLLNSTSYFEIINDRKSFLFIPHPAQVVAIFRILGLGYKHGEKGKGSTQTTLRKNLVQLGTGEGKSVILAVCAVVLSLLGLDVFCVCYSDYLSKRDFQAFEVLFDKLNISQNIHYGTFNKICEHTINERGDIRKMLESVIFENDSFVVKNKKEDSLKVLLIDEVDVFFSKEFYGSSYRPSLELKDSSITNFIKFIWSNRSKADFKMAIDSEEFKEIVKKFPNWKEIFVETVKDIIFELTNFQSHEYVVQDDRIGYKEQDSTVFDTIYGYKTIFAYFRENENGKISNQSLNENTSIFIRLGSFSYAEIPNNKFLSILGVTGTLEHLSQREEDIITKRFEIKERTIIPSVYGRKNIIFSPKDDLLIEKPENHYSIIVQQINHRMQGITQGTQRAVFVVFESIADLFKFYKSNEFLPLKMKSLVLTEEANLDEKKNIINNATVSGKITLFTKIFGRGTDFMVHDKIVSANKGVHVIQTFLSEEYSEEIQIQGRTARQGEDGSYSLILSELALEKYKICKQDLDSHSNDTFEFLNKMRNKFFALKYKENTSYVDVIKVKHKYSMEFLNNLFSKKINLVKSFILEENKGVGLSSNSKTIILMDATCSMHMLLEKTKKTLETMFERVSILLQENGYSESFQIKIVVYRNYSSPDNELLQSSSWECKPQNLIKFLKTVNCSGGWGNEAIEMGLWHANQEQDLSQIILIGDAPANTKDDIKVKKEKYMSKTYKDINTFYADEINVLKSKKIPVHAFFVHHRAKENFTEIAGITEGKCDELKIDTEEGSNDLRNLVIMEIVRKIGGNELVKAYKTKYNAF